MFVFSFASHEILRLHVYNASSPGYLHFREFALANSDVLSPTCNHECFLLQTIICAPRAQKLLDNFFKYIVSVKIL